MSANDPPSPAELAFMKLVANPRAWAQWCELRRKEWTMRSARGSAVIGGPRAPLEADTRPAVHPTETNR